MVGYPHPYPFPNGLEHHLPPFLFGAWGGGAPPAPAPCVAGRSPAGAGKGQLTRFVKTSSAWVLLWTTGKIWNTPRSSKISLTSKCANGAQSGSSDMIPK